MLLLCSIFCSRLRDTMHTCSGRNLGMHRTINRNWEDYCRVVIVLAVEKIFKLQPILPPQGKLSDLYKMCHSTWVKSSCELVDGECLSYDWLKFWCEDILWYWSKYWLFLTSVLFVFSIFLPRFPSSLLAALLFQSLSSSLFISLPLSVCCQPCCQVP